jgi:hypothetical protein
VKKPSLSKREKPMTAITIDPNAVEKIRVAINSKRLITGGWHDELIDSVCIMSVFVPSADDTEGCVNAGWPEWLAGLIMELFRANVGVEDETKARHEFALALAELVQMPCDYDLARNRFLIRHLYDGEYPILKMLREYRVDADWWKRCENVLMWVVELLCRQLDGEIVDRKRLAAVDSALDVAQKIVDAQAIDQITDPVFFSVATFAALSSSSVARRRNIAYLNTMINVKLPTAIQHRIVAACRSDLIAALEASAE